LAYYPGLSGALPHRGGAGGVAAPLRAASSGLPAPVISRFPVAPVPSIFQNSIIDFSILQSRGLRIKDEFPAPASPLLEASLLVTRLQRRKRERKIEWRGAERGAGLATQNSYLSASAEYVCDGLVAVRRPFVRQPRNTNATLR